jgi:hypothetical protein
VASLATTQLHHQTLRLLDHLDAEQVDHLITVLGEVDDRFGFRRPHP